MAEHLFGVQGRRQLDLLLELQAQDAVVDAARALSGLPRKRYDDWEAVPHEPLARLRSAIAQLDGHDPLDVFKEGGA
jgi:hypothetical protein